MKLKTNQSAHEIREDLKNLVEQARSGDTIYMHTSGHKEFKPMNKKQQRQAALEKHYAVCEALGRHLGMEKPNGKRISTALFNIEREAHRCAEGYCNGESRTVYCVGERHEFHFASDVNAWDNLVKLITDRVRAAFGGTLPPNFFVNGDPRGASLKLEPNSVTGIGLHQDWGGYQILSPDLEIE